MANGIEVRRSFTVNVPAAELYAFWRRFSEFPRFMRSLESVSELDGGRSHWVMKGPGGRTFEWDAEIVEDTPGQVLGWRTVGEADVRHGGRVEFRPATGGRGTVVEVHMAYEPPGGTGAAALAKLLGENPEFEIVDSLRRFKRLVETGEIPTTDGQTSGREREAQAEPAEAETVGEVRS